MSPHKGIQISFEMQQIADELHKPFIRKLRKREVYSSFKERNASLADM